MKLSKIESSFLNTMNKMAIIENDEWVVNATMSQIVKASGRKTVGGIHTHILKDLEHRGYIKQIKSNKWILFNEPKYDNIKVVNKYKIEPSIPLSIVNKKLDTIIEYACDTNNQELYDLVESLRYLQI